MRFLYLDDSGKIHVNDPTRVVVFAGYSIDESRWHALVRQINGAKAAFFPSRGKPIGNPNSWELKSSDFLTKNAWNRRKNRQFCLEVANILRRNGCCVYCVSLEKSKAHGILDESTYVPLAFQRLIAKFDDEVRNQNTTGTVVCDWSTHSLDRHITNCVSSLVVTQKMQAVVGGVSYGDSASLPPVQVADLIARTFRIVLEGQAYLSDFEQRLRQLAWVALSRTDVLSFPVNSIFKVF